MKKAVNYIFALMWVLLVVLSLQAEELPGKQPAFRPRIASNVNWTPQLKLSGLVDSSSTNAISLNFENTDIRILLRYLSEITGETIISEPGLRGTITIVNPEPLTVKEAVQVIYSALQLNGYTIIRQEHASKIVRAGDAQTQTIPLYTHSVDNIDDTVRAQVVYLDHISAASAREFALPFLSRGSGKALTSDINDMIVIIDTGPNVKRILELISLVDIPSKQVDGDIKILPLRYINPKEMTRLLADIMNAPAFRDPRFYKRSGRPGYSATFIPVPGRNALIVICKRKDWPMIEKLVKQIDVPTGAMDPDGDTTMIYHLSNAPADTVAATLQKTYQGSLTAVGYKPGNAVVVHASRDMHKILAKLVKNLDDSVIAGNLDFRIAGLTACTVIFFTMCVFLWLFRRRTPIPAVLN